LPDGRLLSWAEYDQTLRLWSGEGAALGELRGHTRPVRGALVLPDGRLLSWSWDKTLRLWSGEGAALGELRGHTNTVRGALVLPDGRLLSWSGRETTLRLWSGEGAALGELRGHTRPVSGALVLPDGRLLSWSSDSTLRLWSGGEEPLGVLEKLNWRDRAGIMAWGRGYGADLAVLFESSPRFGREGDRLHLYDSQSGRLLATFYADAPIRAIQELAEGRVAYGDAYGRMVFLGWRPPD
jgi:WD40 repeat protein